MATSGTVSQTVFTTRKVIEHAFRRCRLSPQQITPEYIEIAKDLLFLELSTLSSKGIPLWCLTRQNIGLRQGVFSVTCPTGTVDILNANLRSQDRLTGTYSSTEGTAANAFDGDVDTICDQTAQAGSITVELDEEALVNTVGLLTAATGTWNIAFQYSDDGVSFTDFYTNTSLSVTDSEWTWLDFQGTSPHLYYRLKANGSTVLDVREWYLGHNVSEVPLARVNHDDYFNLSNRFFQGRPTQYWFNRQRSAPILNLWPVPDEATAFRQIVTLASRYVQDVGSMTQEIEVPQRWYRAIVLVLAKGLSSEIPEVKPEIRMDVAIEADERLREAWDGETDSSPVYLRPNIGPYTR